MSSDFSVMKPYMSYYVKVMGHTYRIKYIEYLIKLEKRVNRIIYIVSYTNDKK